MPIWSEILRELGQTTVEGGAPDFDGVRRRYLAALHGHTRRNVVLYASAWLQKETPPALTSIVENHTGRAFIKQHRDALPAQTLQIGFGPAPDQLNQPSHTDPRTPAGLG